MIASGTTTAELQPIDNVPNRWWWDLPRLNADPDLCVQFKTEMDDFCVEEVLAYELSGTGSHTFALVRKSDLNTNDVVRHFASLCAVSSQEIGIAGQKDRRGLTTQWFSIPGDMRETLLGHQTPSIQVIDVTLHQNKLRLGHARANRFKIVLRSSQEIGNAGISLAPRLQTLERIGVPNYFGIQRFGKEQRNIQSALKWIQHGCRGNKQKGKFYWSVLQSFCFNQWLAQRIDSQKFSKPMLGDLMRKEDTGGLFTLQSLEEGEARMDAQQISPTGPMFGAKMMEGAEEAAELENRVLLEAGLSYDLVRSLRKFGQGTRRASRFFPQSMKYEVVESAIHLSFEIPSGCYATSVMRELVDWQQS